MASQWIVLTSADRQFTEYVESMVRQAARAHWTDREIRSLVLMKADQLSIPLESEKISITGQGESLRTLITYDTKISVPFLDRVVYRMEFSHNFSNYTQR